MWTPDQRRTTTCCAASGERLSRPSLQYHIPEAVDAAGEAGIDEDCRIRLFKYRGPGNDRAHRQFEARVDRPLGIAAIDINAPRAALRGRHAPARLGPKPDQVELGPPANHRDAQIEHAHGDAFEQA